MLQKKYYNIVNKMNISICKSLESEFLKLKPYFSYCFSKDTNNNRLFKEYEFNIKKLSLSTRLEYVKKYRVFTDLNQKETLKISILNKECANYER